MHQPRLIEQLESAVAKREEGDFGGALTDFERLEKLSENAQDIAALRLFQATCLTDLGRSDDALQRMSSVNKSDLIFSEQIDYEYEQARIARAMGNLEDALGRVAAGLKMADLAVDKSEVEVVSAGLRTLRGILLAESGRCDEAEPILAEVPLADQGWAEAMIRLGDCRYKRKQYGEAIQCYLRVNSDAANVHPIHRKTALRNIGCAYYYLGQYAEAIGYLTKVKDSYVARPDLEKELFAMIASAYSHIGDHQEAAKYQRLSSWPNAIQ
jgi:tetratricopeptide (TPR) repeat protein